MGVLGPFPPSPTDQGGLPVPTISVTTEEIAGPDTPTDIPRIHIEHYFRDTYVAYRGYGVPQWAAIILAGIATIPAVMILIGGKVFELVLNVFIPNVGTALLDALDDIRKKLDPEFGKLAVDVLNELLGTTIPPEQLGAGTDFQSHLDRAGVLGGYLHDVLLHEFMSSQQITPESGEQAARRFSGLVINFGTATGVLAAIGGLAPFIHLDDIRMIGEDVAKNLGLGRLHRLAMKPLMDILIAEPYKWAINKVGRPTQFTLADVVNPFSGAIMQPSDIWESLARQGYSDDKIKALLELHRKKLSETDAFQLFRFGLKTQDDVVTYLQRLGYTQPDALDRVEAEFLKDEEPYQKELAAAVAEAYRMGNIPRSELEGILNTAVPLDNERAIALLTADYKKKVPHRSLTVAQLEQALEQGIIDVAEFTDTLAGYGYSDNDTQILSQLTFLKIGKLADAAKAKAAKAAAAAAKKAQSPAVTPTPKTP